MHEGVVALEQRALARRPLRGVAQRTVGVADVGRLQGSRAPSTPAPGSARSTPARTSGPRRSARRKRGDRRIDAPAAPRLDALDVGLVRRERARGRLHRPRARSPAPRPPRAPSPASARNADWHVAVVRRHARADEQLASVGDVVDLDGEEQRVADTDHRTHGRGPDAGRRARASARRPGSGGGPSERPRAA